MLTRFTRLTGARGNGADTADKPSPAAKATSSPAPELVSPEVEAANRLYTEVKVRLHQKLLEEINLNAIEKLDAEAFRQQTSVMITNLLKAERVQLNQREQVQITDDVIDEMIGLGPLEPLLKDPSINDILVNTHRQVFVERKGRLELTPVIFQDEKHLLRIVTKIVSAVGRRVDESQPMVDARLADGSRVNVAIAPVAIDGPLVSIRKFAARPYTLDILVQNGSITEEVSLLLQAIVQSRLNVLISGGTGSGKTTMLNAMSRYIDGRERIITIEDAAELQLQQIHVARMETRPPNVEGKGEIRQRELVKNALRMRPDRIIVGEVRGGEAFDMLQAMNTGHDGSMTTVHANTPRDALSRLEQMIGMADLDLSPRSMRQQIASALHVVIQLQRLSDGRRKLVSLTEVTGMEGEVVQQQEIFRFVRRKTDTDGTVHGEFRATGIRPKFMNELQTRGIEMPPRAFEPDRILG
jgi:pilus assembly protein CpaF